MKIAFIALPQPQGTVIRPPLPLGYIAALLEQQRHIVRIYDLALSGLAPLADVLQPLRAFRPHIVVIEAIDPAMTASVEAALAGCDAAVIRLEIGLRETTPGQAVAQAGRGLRIAGVFDRLRMQREENPGEAGVLTHQERFDAAVLEKFHRHALERTPVVGDLRL